MHMERSQGGPIYFVYFFLELFFHLSVLQGQCIRNIHIKTIPSILATLENTTFLNLN